MRVSFLTYNIHKGIGNDRLFRLERILETLREADADIIALQEVDQYAPRSRTQDLARVLAEELGMAYNLGLNVKLSKGAYGNATLSRFPIKESRNLNITWGIKKRRGCLVSRINLPVGDIAVFNFHLGLAAFERMWQVRKILQSPSHDSMRNLPTIILGDGNDRRHKLNALFLQAGYPDTCTENSRANNTFPSYAPLFRLDKVFASKHWKVNHHHVIRTKVTRVASDHFPLNVVLQLDRKRQK
ncbi:MAG: endonuclease/exonuclease/phosphatase family protein [Spirochaetales bacterium]|nr:endonuclease/exonuclease/phosphatase family protein [Spirochaetales bacterium]